MTSLIEPIKIKNGEKIAQLIVCNILHPEIKKVKYLKETERNDKGFGEMDSNYKRVLIKSNLLLNKTRQIVYFHYFVSIFCVLLSNK